MKLLRNPVFVGILAAVALAMVFWNVVRPMLHRGGRSAPQPSATPPPPAAATTAAAPSTKPLLEQPAPAQISRAATIDLSVAHANSPRWTESPRRDPFQMRNQGAKPGTFRNAMEMLKLSAVWRQTGGILAVINNRVIGEGETILDFKIQNIESDRVWVEGPNGREHIEFKYSSTAETGGEATLPETKAAAVSEETKASLYQDALRSETIENVTWGNGVATAKVGTIFYGLKFELKQNIAKLILDHANSKGGKCEQVILTDLYSNKKVGAYSDKLGLNLE